MSSVVGPGPANEPIAARIGSAGNGRRTRSIGATRRARQDAHELVDVVRADDLPSYEAPVGVLEVEHRACNYVDGHVERWPARIGRQQAVGLELHRGREHQCVGETDCAPVPRAEGRRRPGESRA